MAALADGLNSISMRLERTEEQQCAFDTIEEQHNEKTHHSKKQETLGEVSNLLLYNILVIPHTADSDDRDGHFHFWTGELP